MHDDDANGWMPIETAPKDTVVLVYMPWTGLVRQARYNLGRGRAGWHVHFNAGLPTTVVQMPTHWQPLPKPPVQP